VKQEKLDALYARATDERTPEEERRTSAVLYLKHAPRWKEPTKEELLQVFTKDIARQVLSEEIALLERTAADAKSVAENKSKRAEKAESDLRELKDAIRAARAADEKVTKLINGELPKTEPRSYSTRPDFASQINDIFNNSQGPIGYNPGGFKW
jgi:hypothetical protein